MATHNPFASFKFSTNSQYMRLQANPTMYASYPAWSHLRVSIDGTLSYHLFANTIPETVSLGVGTKIIEITEGGTTKPGASVLGTFITAIRLEEGSSFTILDTDAPTDKLVFLGNSITVGANSTYLTQGFPMLFRDAGRNSSVLGYGYGSIKAFANTVPLITDTVSDINVLADGTSTNKLLILLGTNDYAVDLVPVADFQTKYSDLLVAINASRPDIDIMCISPIVRTNDGANANGDTLADFRTAVEAAATGKAYCTYVDGTTLMAAGDLSDGVHPTIAGHIAIYNALELLI